MKALLLKDTYMMRKYCRSYLLMVAVFLAVSMLGTGNAFFLVYPCMLAGLIPMTMLAYDENSRWDRYCAALPFTKRQIVSAKYLLGLILIACMAVVSIIAVFVKQAVSGTVSVSGMMQQILIVLTTAFLAPSISLPLVFKFGVERGRAARFVVIGVICGIAVFVPELLGSGTLDGAWVLPAGFLVSVVLFAVSWKLSQVFYSRREI